MKAFSEYNPIPVFVYFISVTLIAMFFSDPYISAASLFGAVSLYITRNGTKGALSHLAFFALFCVMALINPLFSHNGKTVLFVLNDNPVTLEALIYGVSTSAAIISVIYWFRSFSQIMTSDRLLYLFGSLSPGTALLLSMTLRYIPLFGEQTEKVNRAQRAMGLYKDDNIIDGIRGGTRVFSVMVTWALENGIITANSMEARGYGTGRRTFFRLCKIKTRDILLIILTLILSGLTVVCSVIGEHGFMFYPELISPPASALYAALYASYGILSIIPFITETGANLRWRYLKSGI